jgi:F-type H+-transporting ATPase subunit b
VLIAVATLAGESLVSLRLHTTSTEPPTTDAHEEEAAAEDAGNPTEAETHELDEGPSPIAPELKELAWGAGSFIVLAVVMRYLIYPRLREGMRARYESIQQGFTDADALRTNAKAEVAQYETALAGLKAEAAARVDVARNTLEAERQERLTEVNARIAERRAAAATSVEEARRAAAGEVDDAVGSVASRLAEMVIGKAPSDATVRSAVDSVTNVGAHS